ncbi:hypothetical protein [Paraburkholderia sp. J10-1]|uniref:hypothetical protein n=1 Tax=Paraburkholderia sp. J10-1 TaxID=2805430 RepID=UPI002AB6AD36|nr:hypothetical protein [Paraburkholderia sp. J10-1]
MVGDLQLWLEAHAPEECKVDRRKADCSTQDLGAILVLLGPIAGAMASAFLEEAAREAARSVAAWMRKRRLTVNVEAPAESPAKDIKPDEAERVIFAYLIRQYPEFAAASNKSEHGDAVGQVKLEEARLDDKDLPGTAARH